MDLRLVVVPLENEDPGEAAVWLTSLGAEVSGLDDVIVEQWAGPAPTGAKGTGLLAALVAKVSVDLGRLLELLRAWVVRTGRTVEVSLDGDTIKITGASREQQDKVIGAWLGRHASST
jgi:hypothetical protein